MKPNKITKGTFVTNDKLKEMNQELCDILNMEWVWLCKKPLDRLLKWQDWFESLIVEEEQS